MNKEALMTDKKLLVSLEDQYNKTRREADSIRAFVSDLNFEDNVPDQQERFLIMDQLHVYEQAQANLINRIRFYRDRVKMQEDKEKIAEHLEHEQREFMPILDKMNKTFQLTAFSNINQEKFEAFQKGDISLQEFLESVPCNEAFLKAVIQYLGPAQLNHCGQDVQDADDACCQARAGRVDHTVAPAAVKELPDSIAQLVGMQVVSAFRPGWKCEECAFSHIDFARCEKKVELVGGYYLCLAPLPNSIITE